MNRVKLMTFGYEKFHDVLSSITNYPKHCFTNEPMDT